LFGAGHEHDQFTACFAQWIIKATGVENVNMDELFEQMREGCVEFGELGVEDWFKNWLHSWPVAEANEDERRLRKLELLRYGLADSSPGVWFWSFCRRGWVQNHNTDHCVTCKKCEDWRDWHDGRHRRCTYG